MIGDNRKPIEVYSKEQISALKAEIAKLEAVPKIDFNAHLLPKRTADTMSTAIAFASPSGHISNAAKENTTKSLGKALFGDYTPDIRHPDDIVERLRDLYYARDLISMVNAGSKKRTYIKTINSIIN